MTAFTGSGNAAKAQLNIVLLVGLVLATALLLPLRGVEPVSAASEGDLDTSFDTDGWHTISGNDLWFEAMSVVVQSSGKTVIAGARMNGMQFDPLLARFNVDGSLDTSFGSDGTGIVVEPWPNGETIMEWVNRSGAAVDIALLSDDRIVMTSSPSGNDERHGIMLFNSNGVLDTSFSGDGRLKIASGGPNVDVWTTAVTVTSDDKITIVGTSPDSNWDYRMKVYRLNSDGSLDTSFSNDGMRNINFPGGVDHLANAVVMAGDKTVVGGSAAASWQRHDMGIAQLKANGQNDLAGFADGAGKLYVDFGFGDSDVRELLVQADGKIVAIGESQVFDNDDSVAVVRLNADGSLDTSFSGDGKFAHDFENGDSYGWAGALDEDGRIVIAGQYNNGATDKAFVMRLTTAGELDTTFGTGGIRTYDFIGGNAESFNAISLSGSSIMVAGATGSSALTARLQTADTFEIAPVCSNGNTLGMYQSITVSGVVTFKELDVDLGEYVDVPGVSLDLRPFGPWSDSVQINGAGVDPTSGKLFGAINIGSTSHIIQFDLTSPTPSVGFVGNFSSGNVWAADFLADGTFVFHDDVASVNKVRSISNLSGLPVFETRTEAPVLSPQTHQATVFENAGDITTVRQADGTELLIGYDYPANKVAVVDASDLDSGALYTTTLPDGFDTSGYNDVVGAAWVSSSGDAYFSLNNGGGIYAVFADDLDTVNQTAVLSATEVTSTQQTNQNDGFGCPTAADVPEEAGAASGILISFDPNGGTPDPFPTAECGGDGLFTVPGPPTRPGFDFVAWVGPEGQTESPYGLASCDVQSWTAQWEAVNHTWTYDPDNGDPVETESCPDQVDTAVNAAPTKDGFDFLRWSVVGEVSTGNANPGDVLPCVESMTFTAQWAATPDPEPDPDPDPEPDGDLDGDGVSDGDEEPGCEFHVDCDFDGLTDDLDADDNDPDQDGDSILDGAENAGCITDPDPSCGETIEENIDTTTSEPESVVLPATGTDQPKWPILLLIAVGSALLLASRRPRTAPEITELH